jgi:nucleoside-diphosphate-sugar epimerase
VKVLVTGATGFVGSRLVGRLLERGDIVVGLARSPASAQKLIDRGCKFVQGSLSQEPAVRTAVQGCTAVFHLAAVGGLGIRRSAVGPMEAANVGGTTLLLQAARDESVERIIHVSSVSVFGDTQGEVVDEEYVRTDLRFLSHFDRTKYEAHQVALTNIRAGAPVIIAQPGAVYGPGPASLVGHQLRRAATGTLRQRAFPELGLVFVHVDDLVEGLLLALEQGRPGEAYVLGGERATLGDALDRAACVGGVPPPSRTISPRLMRTVAPLSPLLSRVTSVPANLGEFIRACDSVTYWASDAKARRELGYAPRELKAGIQCVLDAPDEPA